MFIGICLCHVITQSMGEGRGELICNARKQFNNSHVDANTQISLLHPPASSKQEAGKTIMNGFLLALHR